MDWGGWKRYALVAVLVVAVLVVLAMLYGRLPWWIDGARLRALDPKDQAGILSSDRGDVLKMVAGAGALVALVYTARKHALDRKAHALTEQGQVTDRYTKAIAQLASEKESERVGGIYALERIMADSVRDHPTVVEVLAAFVRQRASLGNRGAAGERQRGAQARTGRMRSRVPVADEPTRPAADVQAAMTVLARRPDRPEPFTVDLRRTALAGIELPPRARLARADLTHSDLTGANLPEATLTGAVLHKATLIRADLHKAALAGADLGGATLTEAILGGATLTGAHLAMVTLTGAFLTEATLAKANLGWANLTGANLTGANLTGANLGGATLTEAILVKVTLTGADLIKVTLTGADLSEATLTGARRLAASQLADAVVVSSTELDEELSGDVWVRARIEACKYWPGYGPVPPRTPDPSNVS